MEEYNIKTKKYKIILSNSFKKDYKRIKKQNKDLNKLKKVVFDLANGEELAPKYRNHRLINDKYFKDCYECHIEPDWLLIYKIENNELILILYYTGSHSELFS